MSIFFRLLTAELIKIRRSVVLRFVWLFPLIFISINFLLFDRSLLARQVLTSKTLIELPTMPLRTLATIWAGLLHPMLLVLVPVMILKPEHLFKQWKYLHALPIARRSLFLAKALTMLLVFGVVLGLAVVGLWVEWTLLARFKPMLAFPFPWTTLVKTVGWTYLGSLPLLGLYLWLADRISSSVVPTLIGIAGLILTISLGGQGTTVPWKRDIIPWVLPYTCAQLTLPSQQEAHLANTPSRENEPKLPSKDDKPVVITGPDGRQMTILPPAPLPPIPPTPNWVLAAFGLGGGILFLGLGLAEAGRDRI